ncbi:tetratricopeptide repeat protein [Numidum massiliense]|uniref:tetratricopeptide repeat protein n=1 Tax=Numidum massiliense TaxID=1522315 RepID=UPI0006D55144|nr:hypothetical protein [Numidum massiliense]
MGNVVSVNVYSERGIPFERSNVMRICEELSHVSREEREPDLFWLLYQTMRSLLKQKRLQEFHNFLREMEQYPFPPHTEYMDAYIKLLRAFLLRAQGKTQAAAGLLKQSLHKHGELTRLGMKNVHVLCYRELGNLGVDCKKYKDAIVHYQLAINHLPLNKDSEYMLAVLLGKIVFCNYRLNNFREAFADLEKVLLLVNKSSHTFVLLQAVIFKALLLGENYRQYRESNDCLEWAHELAVRNRYTDALANIWRIRGINYCHLEQYVSAEQAIQQSIMLSGDFDDREGVVLSQLVLSELLIVQGRKREAKQLLKNVCETINKQQLFTDDSTYRLKLLCDKMSENSKKWVTELHNDNDLLTTEVFAREKQLIVNDCFGFD